MQSFISMLAGFDHHVLELLRGPYFSITDQFLPFLSHLGDMGAVWLILALLLLLSKSTRKASLAIFCALIFSLLLNNIGLKNLFERDRPCQIDGVLIDLICPADASFPSGHAASSFASAFAVWFLNDLKLKPLSLLMIALASAIAYSRIFLNVHYPSDCLAGLFVGLLCGYWAAHAVKLFKLIHNHS